VGVRGFELARAGKREHGLDERRDIRMRAHVGTCELAEIPKGFLEQQLERRVWFHIRACSGEQRRGRVR
jgi:hypothetical protein